MRLPVNCYSLSNFTWIPATRTLSTFVSGLRDFRLRQVWDDACDVGIQIKSTTGKVVLFTLVEEHHSDEMELTHWELISYQLPKEIKMVIFND